MEVFPFAFIWRAMLELDLKISSDELNCEIFYTRNEDDLAAAIDRIANAREHGGNASLMRPRVLTGRAANDRIISWIALAGFGYTLLLDKSNDPGRTYYRIRDDAVPVLERASSMRLPHREFTSTAEYVEYISDLAGLPPTLPVPDHLAVSPTPARDGSLAISSSATEEKISEVVAVCNRYGTTWSSLLPEYPAQGSRILRYMRHSASQAIH